MSNYFKRNRICYKDGIINPLNYSFLNLELEYLGAESNRTSSDSLFLMNAKQQIRQLVLNSTELEDDEVTVLDIGCGTQASFLTEVADDLEIAQEFTKDKFNYTFFGISSNFENVPEDIITFKKFLRASEGLKFLPENLKFNYIYSSWCMNYLGPNTFEKVLEDSLERLKPFGEMDIYPFRPVVNSSAFPYGLNISHEVRELFYDSPKKGIGYLKNRIKTLASVLDIEIEEIENIDDGARLESIVNRYFREDVVTEASKDIINSYSNRIFREKVKRMKNIISDRYLVRKYSMDGLRGINIRKLY